MKNLVKKNLHKNKRCFIIGTGTSLNDIDMSLFKDEITIGVNLLLLKEDFVPNYLVVADTTVVRNNYNTIFNNKMKSGYYVLGNGCTMTGKGSCTSGPGSTCSPSNLDLEMYPNIYQLTHKEKSGIFIDHIDDDRSNLLKIDQYYIDPNFEYFTSYGASTIDNLAIPLAVYLGFKEIYLLGCDGGWNHFYKDNSKSGKREWINYKHVLPLLDKLNIRLCNSDPTNQFPELEYIELHKLLNI
tara:strand:+ start:1222 stop:1944 length:723 start_codon:yes stop_codon:yes gene_type:complete